MAGVASQAGDAYSSQAPGLNSGLQGSVNVHRGAVLLVPQWRCISSFVFYILCHTCSLCRVELVVQFSARGSTQVLLCLFLVCCGCGCGTFYIVSVHVQCQSSIYTLSLCRGHSWRVRLAKQEMLTPPGTWSHLWFAGVRECPPWCSIVGATVTVHQFFCILPGIKLRTTVQERENKQKNAKF